jgi:hypothetical protein
MKKILLFTCLLVYTSVEHTVNNSIVGISSNVPDSDEIFKVSAEDQIEYVFFFAHGLAATKNQVNLFIKEHKKSGAVMYNDNYIVDIPHVSFDFPDSVHALDPSAWFLPLRKLIANLIRGNYDQTSFAQDNEIELLHAIYNTHVPKDKKVIFGGISRGASIFFTWPSLHGSTNIAAAIIESPYACIADVVNFKRKQFGIELILSENNGQAIMEFIFGKYKRSGLKPIDCIKCVDQNIPLLIIASKSDTLVPWESSFLLYQALREDGHQKVHFILLEKGEHGFLLSGPDGKRYQRVVHAFYKYYGLPCNNELATAGETDFMKTIG